MLEGQKRIVISTAVLAVAVIVSAEIKGIWTPLLLLIPFLPWTVPSFRQRVEARRLPDVIWHGIFNGLWFGVLWSAIGDTGERAALKGVLFGVVMSVVYAAMWERQRQKTQERVARRDL